MKKLLITSGFALLSFVVVAQERGTEAYWKELERLGCRGTENLDECKARIRRETIERKRVEDSLKREKDFLMNKYGRDEWQKQKERRDKLTPEERQKEDQARLDAKKKKTEDETEVFAGGNMSDKSGTDPGYTPIPGIMLGAQTQLVNITDEISLGLGVVYSMQGGKYESSEYIPGGTYGTRSNTSRLNYLNFPVLIRYRKARGGFFGEAGIQPGLLVSAKDKGNETTDIKDEINKLDVGIPLGVGYKFKNKFGVGLRVTPGLTNVNKDASYKNRNMVASFRAIYTL